MKTNLKGKRYLEGIQLQQQAMQCDWHRRLRNALLALASMDPAWMIWIESHVRPGIATQMAARIVEHQAKTLLMQKYQRFGNSVIQSIIRGDQFFGDDGNLLTG